MGTMLRANVRKRGRDRVSIEFTRDDFEAFCNALGLYRKEFLKLLDASEEDHRRGRTRRRKSLRELVR